MVKSTEILVIGAGPAGYVAAIRAAQLGKKVALVERDKLGGECMNYGCIPSKALINVANLVEKIGKAGEMGVNATTMSLDVEKLQSWKDNIVRNLTSGIVTLCQGHGIAVFNGNCQFVDSHTVEVTSSGGNTSIEADKILIATGTIPISLPKMPIDEKRIVSSRTALEFKEIPKRLLVIGGGVIGLEIGMMYSKLGSELTIVELTETLLPGTDPSLVRVVSRCLRKAGAKIHLLSQALGCNERPNQVEVSVQTPEGPITIEADRVLMSVGRRPNTQQLRLENCGVKADSRGWIPVNNRLQTNIPHIYAAGDVVGPPLLAHKASREGVAAAEAMADLPTVLDHKAMPNAIFTDPEISSVGWTEKEATDKGHSTVIGRFPFSASGRAQAGGESEGFIKIVADKESNLILGVHIVGHDASHLIGEAALAIEMGATVDDLALTVHPHPTLSESLAEAAEDVHAKAIHILRLR